jgi:hypothetical protein
MEGSLVAYKVFTNGSVLNASEINDNLMNQSVMVFSNSAARLAAIPSPLAGMLTFLEDTGLYSSWNGSAWVALDVSLISSNSFTTSSSVNIDGVFSTNFQNYNVSVELRSSTSNTIRFQWRAGGANETGSVYYYGGMGVGTYTSQAFFSTNASIRDYHALADSDSTAGLASELNLFNPNTIIRPTILGHSSGAFMVSNGSTTNTTTQYTGFRIFPTTGNITGTVRVYGLRN